MKRNNLASMLHKSMYMVMAVFAAFAMTACNSDDDGEGGGGNGGSNFETPLFEASAAKYEITDASSPFKSVELTSSGNFIIRMNSIASGSSASAVSPATNAKAKMLVNPDNAFSVAKTRAGSSDYIVWSDILYGTYTKTGENEYYLVGYGTLTVTSQGGSAYSLRIERTSGETYDLEANKAGTPDEGAMTDKLCRTWNIVGYRYFIRFNGQYYADITASSLMELQKKINEWADKNDPDYEEGDYDMGIDSAYIPRQVVFSKSGTYMVLYESDVLAVSTWRWQNQDTGMLQYSWNPDSFDDNYISGYAKIEFSNNQLRITEGESDSEDGFSYEIGTTTILDEVVAASDSIVSGGNTNPEDSVITAEDVVPKDSI